MHLDSAVLIFTFFPMLMNKVSVTSSFREHSVAVYFIFNPASSPNVYFVCLVVKNTENDFILL